MDGRTDERDQVAAEAARAADAAYDFEMMRRFDYWDDADDIDAFGDEEDAA